jgi:hypothetical protein
MEIEKATVAVGLVHRALSLAGKDGAQLTRDFWPRTENRGIPIHHPARRLTGDSGRPAASGWERCSPQPHRS